MANQAYPTVRDQSCSWSDIQINVAVDGGASLDVFDISGIKWSRKVEVGVQKGASGGRVMKRTSGEGSCEASMTLYRSGLRQLINALVAVAPTRGNQVMISSVVFDILVQHTPLGETEIYTTKIKGCRYLGDSDDMKEGTDADQIEVTLNPMEIATINANGQEVVLL